MNRPLHLLETTVLGDIRRFAPTGSGLESTDLVSAVTAAVNEADTLWGHLDPPPGVSDDRWRHLAITVGRQVRINVLIVRQIVLGRDAFVAVDVRLRRVDEI